MRNHQTIKVLLALAVAVGGLIPAAGVGAATSNSQTVTSGSLGGVRYHVVASGDSVVSIAKRYGVDADQIRRINGIVGDMLYLGARILLDPPNPGLSMRTISSSTPAAGSSSSSGSTSTASAGTYTVKEGDVLERIARRQGVKLSALLAANDLEATSIILPGRKLTIPGTSSTPSSGSSTSATPAGTYTVKEGDVLERIARRQGVKLSALLAANGLEATTIILPGRKLTIPSSSSAAASTAASSSSTPSAAPSGSGSTGSASFAGPQLVCPVPGATFMNDWGFPRGDERYHEGTDLFAAKGTTIVAPVSGVVSFGSNNLGGTTFNILTADGWSVYGAHLSATIGDGGQVAAGTPIGSVGNSGDADGGDTHLHLQIRPAAGKPMNPYPSVLAACG